MVCCANKLNKLSSQVCRLNYHTNLYLSTRWQSFYSIHAALSSAQNDNTVDHQLVGVLSTQTEVVELLKSRNADMVPVPTDMPGVTLYILCDVAYLAQFKSGVLATTTDLHELLFSAKQTVDNGVMAAKFGGDVEVLGTMEIPPELISDIEPSIEDMNVNSDLDRMNDDTTENMSDNGRTLEDVEARLKEILDVTETETTVI